MGCGSSSAAGASKPGARDSEDFYVEHLSFQKLDLKTLDDFLGKVEEPVNTVIDISNEINSCVDDIREAAGAVVGALLIQVDMHATSHDRVFVSMEGGTRESLREVFAKDAVKAADTALTSALNAIHAAKPSDLAVDGDHLTGGGVEGFNKALGELKTALGEGFKLHLHVSKSEVSGEASVAASVKKAVFPEGSDTYSLTNASVGDILRTSVSKEIAAAQCAAASAAAALAKAIKQGGEKDVSATLTLKKRRISATITGEDTACKSAISSAVSGVNSANFKVFKACSNAQGDVNLVRAMVVVIEGLLEGIVKKAKAAGKEMATDAIKSAIKINTEIKFSAEEFEFSFDFGVDINMPEFSGEPWQKLLTPQAKMIWETILAVKDRLVEQLPKFKELSEQVQELMNSVPTKDELKADVEAKTAGDAFAAAKLMAKVGGTLSAITNSPKTIKVFMDTAARVNTDLESGVVEMKIVIGASA